MDYQYPGRDSSEETNYDERTPLHETGTRGVRHLGQYDTGTSNKPQKAKVTLRLCIAVFSAVMGSVEFGYNTGVINAPETQIKDFINTTHYERTESSMSDVTVTSLFAFIVAVFAVGGMIGGLAAGWLADTCGRKFGMIINSIVGIVACGMMYLCRSADSYEMIIIGRLLVGVSCGVYTGLAPLYLSEISSSSNRGAIGTLHQLGVVTGLLASQILGFPEILGNSDYWNLLLGVGLVPCLIQLLTMPVCPESPRYLLLKKNQEIKARRALEILRGTVDVDFEIEEMNGERRANLDVESLNVISLLKKKSLRKPLLISIMMHLSQQLSGINAIFYYSFNLFKQAGLDKTTAAHATSGVGGTMIIMTLITVPLMDRAGRRTLHLIGLGGMFTSSILITLCLALSYLAEWLKIITVIMSLLYVMFFATGPGSIPWLIVSELFAQGSRSAAMSISVLVNWVANFAVGFSFPYMQSGLKEYSFLPFSVLLGIFFILTGKYVPETKNRTIMDITRIWDKDTREQYLEHAADSEDECDVAEI